MRTFLVLLTSTLSLSISAAAAAQDQPPKQDELVTPVPVPVELLQVQPGGLTAEQVGARAAATSWSAKAADETLRAAAARLDQAWAAFLPRLSGIGRYTRLSEFTPPQITPPPPPGINSVVTTAPVDGNPTQGPFFAAPISSFSFPIILDNWLFQGTINVPISDYALTINQRYTAATRSQEAARWDVVTARAKSASDGRIAYYTWLRARGDVVVAVQSLDDRKTHLKDARNQFAAGNASRTDVLRAETDVANAELVVTRARGLAVVTEKQLRVAIHAGDEETLAPGEDLESTPPPVVGNPKQMTIEAYSARPELKSADANAAAARQTSDALKAGRYPNLSAFADGIYANPNPRRFPARDEWFPTWDVGAQVTWSPNDVLVANAGAGDYEARAAAIVANAMVVRDGIDVEVQQAWQGVRDADFEIEVSLRERASAEEAHRVARELFNNGRGTATTLADAETELTRSRFDVLNAKANARIARIRLDHALGRDAAAGGASGGAARSP